MGIIEYNWTLNSGIQMTFLVTQYLFILPCAINKVYFLNMRNKTISKVKSKTGNLTLIFPSRYWHIREGGQYSGHITLGSSWRRRRHYIRPCHQSYLPNWPTLEPNIPSMTPFSQEEIWTGNQKAWLLTQGLLLTVRFWLNSQMKSTNLGSSLHPKMFSIPRLKASV